jgi:secreted trypsin-like serine protease
MGEMARMRLALSLVVVAAALAPSAAAIHRGSDAPIASYRFMVSLRLAATPDSPRCGGTLIAPDIVLTAAHCVLGVPQGGLVAVVASDVADWPSAPRVATVRHRSHEDYDVRIDSRHDIALVRLAARQSTPGVRLAAAEPRVGSQVTTVGWGCVSAPPTCEQRATALQASAQRVIADTSCGRDVFFVRPTFHGPGTICTKGVRSRSTVNRGDSGGPLLVADKRFGVRQVGVTALGADSKIKLYAGFTSIPREARWISAAITSLRAA